MNSAHRFDLVKFKLPAISGKKVVKRERQKGGQRSCVALGNEARMGDLVKPKKLNCIKLKYKIINK